jgi:hypothetical protein
LALVHALLRRAHVTRPYPWYVFILLLAVVFATPSSASAQQAASTPPPSADGGAAASTPSTPDGSAPAAAAAQASADDEDALYRPLEPDFTLINLPTTLPLPLHKGNFRLTHRFNGNLEAGSFGDQASNFFGLDEGATIGFEYRFAIVRHVEVAAYRTNLDRTVQIYGKYDALQEGGSSPIGLSALVSVEGTNNFRQQYTPTLGATISRDVGNLAAVYVVPMWVHNVAAASGVMRDTGIIGLGANLRVRRSLYVLGEVSPRLGGYVIGDPEYGFGLSARVGGHVFDLTFTNGQDTTFAQMARGGFPNTLYLGFNLARKFF